jgi:calcineurin-like phosphoesterase family protein
MDEILISRWNERVSPEDEVFHLGYVALGDKDRWLDIFSRLNGYKILVIGNHDRIFGANSENYQQKFIELYNQMFDDYYDNLRGFWLDDGTIVDLSHFPYDGDSHDGDRYTDYRLTDAGRVLIHGHTHSSEKMSRSKRGSLQIHVGVDAWDYRPVSEDEIIELIESEIK